MAESLVASRWGASVVVRDAEKIWDRSHIVRLRLAGDDRTAVLSGPGREPPTIDPEASTPSWPPCSSSARWKPRLRHGCSVPTPQLGS